MSDTPSYGIDVLSNPKYPYFDNSNTSKQEFCYIPKDNIFLGHPVVWTNAFQNSDKTGPWNLYSRVASMSVNEENDKKIQKDMKGNENDKNQYE